MQFNVALWESFSILVGVCVLTLRPQKFEIFIWSATLNYTWKEKSVSKTKKQTEKQTITNEILYNLFCCLLLWFGSRIRNCIKLQLCLGIFYLFFSFWWSNKKFVVLLSYKLQNFKFKTRIISFSNAPNWVYQSQK